MFDTNDCEFNFVGVDIAKDNFQATMLVGGGERSRKFDNNQSGIEQFNAWLKKFANGKTWLCMEHTNKYWQRLAMFIAIQGHRVSVINAYTFSSYASGQRRSKNDEIDAKLLATYCRDWKPQLWEAPSEEQRKLTEVSRARYLLKKQYAALLNHLGTDEFDESREAVQNVMAELDNQINRLAKVEDEIIENSPAMKAERDRWMQICGIGKETPKAILAEIGFLSKFKTYAPLRRFVGLDSVRNQSGSSLNGKPYTSKKGNARIRAYLNLCAKSAKLHNLRFIAFADNLRKRGKLECVINTAIANKLLLTIWAMSRDKTDFDMEHTPKKCEAALVNV
jgi:transposase